MSKCKEREFDSDDNNIYDVEFVYGKKMFKKRTYYAVKWLGWTIQQMSWEPVSNFTSIHSLFNFVRRLETRLCYSLYYKKVAQNTNGIRVHIKGKFCQIQQVNTNLKKKSIGCEKQIVSCSQDTSSPFDKAQKIITYMKQNFLTSNNSKIHQKIQKKVCKQKNNFRKILNQQENNEVISITSLSPIRYEVPKQNKKKSKQNKKESIDYELEKDIKLLIQNELQEKKLKKKESQTQRQKQILSQKNNNNNNNNNKVFVNVKLFSMNLKIQNYQNQFNKIKIKKNPQNYLSGTTALEFPKTHNLSSFDVQEKISQPQEESFEIDLQLTEDCEQQQKPQQLNELEKLKDVHIQNFVSVSTSSLKNQCSKFRVVKSVFNPKIIKNTTQEDSNVNKKTEKNFISQIMEVEQKGEGQQKEKFPFMQLFYREPKIQTSVKTSQQIQQEIQKLQLEKIKLNRTNRCSILIIPKLKEVGVQYIKNNFMNTELILYDMELNEVKLKQIIVETIESHHFLIGKLLFRCLYEDGDQYYVEYDTLKRYCPTLLLDYMIVNSILI
ncbi:unnamed protein product (macronuclear) [Paramecium tetraurelia]|uniref:Chromo domain-containing protein n=1 Tax=Paramecium tetraurelia TaxID=5888 RepID=A0C4F8_PARTE|nr:uncharacterized protein GSPATT00035155001 [Paramecium tetraurelia]CAK65675.1 unnamed protein product [Paramecium tetraurelia]|eukprot:XP_001433072.1 hypothetical protein (macronuclear) [Paramecium tetraurelia strain d4-2]